MEKKKYNEEYSYTLYDDGYEIEYYDKVIIRQRGEYGKPYRGDKSYEENCLMQLEELVNSKDIPADNDKLRADLDYMALMLDVTLPSEEEEE